MTKLFLTYSYDDGPLWIHESRTSAEKGRREFVSYSIEPNDPEFESYVDEVSIFEVEMYNG